MLSFLLPSFPALPTLKAGSNHRVAGAVAGQWAAVTVHSTSPAPPVWPSGSGTDDGKLRRQAVVLWLCPSSMAAPAGASTQSLPTSSGMSSRCGCPTVGFRACGAPRESCGLSHCSPAVWASAWAYTGSGPGLLMVCLQSEGLRSSWFTILGILSFPSGPLIVRQG